MPWKSGRTSYVVHETPREVLAGVHAIAEREGLHVLETNTRRGVRLVIEAIDHEEGAGIPAFEVGEVELRFSPRGQAFAVEVCSHRRRRWWTLGVVGILGIGTVFVDLIASMGFLTLELSRAVRRTNELHDEGDPLLLHAVSSFLGPRDIGEIGAAPFRRGLPGGS